MRLLPLLFAVATAAFSQEVSGSIDGHVKDSTGAGIAGAKVTLTHEATGTTREAVTAADGSYAFPNLAIGAWRILAQHEGFKRGSRGGIELHIGDKAVADITLEVGDVVQEVTVETAAVQVQTESAEQGGLISGDQVRELQLNGRSFMTLLELLPGVASDMPDRADPNTNPALSINGGRSSTSSFNIDGGNNADVIVGGGSLNTFTSVETIAEVKVVTSTFSAEYGRGGFAQVNVVTRGGTNRFRGSIYEFLRNDRLDARDYFSHQVLPLKLNNFGYTFGGPIQRNKTFFFWTQEFNHLSSRGEAVTTTVPDPAHRRGDFSNLGPGRDGIWETADDPVVDPDTLLGFPGGRVPASRMHPAAVKLLALFPDPNFRGPGAINYTSAAASLQRWREELIRIDRNFGSKHKLYGRWAQDSAYIRNPYGGSSLTSIGTRFPGLSTTRATRPGKNLTVSATSVFSQRLINEARFVYSGREITQNPLEETARRDKLGISIPEIFPENDGNVIPTIALGSGYATLGVSRVWLKQLFNLEASNNLTYLRGRHNFKTGGIWSYGGNRENPTAPLTNGQFSYTTAFSKNPIANMLLGLPFTYTEAERFVVSKVRFGFFEAFVQDDIRATSRLTLNLGLRLSNYFHPYDTDNVISNFIPALWKPEKAPRIDSAGRPVPGSGDLLNGVVTGGAGSPYGRRITNNNLGLLAPRFGFNWDFTGRQRTTLRGGYGLNFNRTLIGTFINAAFDNPPFSRSVTIQQPAFDNPGGGSSAPLTVVNLTSLQTPIKPNRFHQMSLGIQHQLLRQSILDVAYVGTRGRDLLRPFSRNAAPPGEAARRGVNVNAVRPYPGFGTITERQSTAISDYHALQVAFNRRLASKHTLGIAYTWSKSIDDGSSDRGGSDIPPDSTNPRAERGLSDADRKHILTVNGFWWLPDAVSKGNAASWLLNGWQLSGILRLWSGRPLDVQLSSDVAGIGATQNQRPNVIADTRGPRTVEEWFHRDAFARPATGTFGNMGRNSMRGPGVNKWDLSLFKNFRFGEARRELQFRSELFNAFNHPSYTTIGTSLTTTAAGVNPAANSFGVVTGTRDARVMQFALKLSF